MTIFKHVLFQQDHNHINNTIKPICRHLLSHIKRISAILQCLQLYTITKRNSVSFYLFTSLSKKQSRLENYFSIVNFNDFAIITISIVKFQIAYNLYIIFISSNSSLYSYLFGVFFIEFLV